MWEAHRRDTRAVAFHPSTAILATAGFIPNVNLWTLGDAPVEIVEGDFPVNKGRPGAAATFSSDGKQLAIITTRLAFVSVWDVASRRHYRTSSQISDWGYSLTFHPGGDRLAAGLERDVALWNPADYRPPTIFPAHAGAVLGVAFTPDGQTLLTGGADGLIKLWDPAGRLRHTFDWKIREVGAVAFAPDGLTAAAGGAETILVWDVAG
jgi:WD40 repeat protein